MAAPTYDAASWAQWSGTATNSIASGTLSPGAGRLLLVLFEVRGAGVDTTSMTVSGLGLTWSRVGNHVFDSQSIFSTELWAARTGGSAPSPGAITAACTFASGTAPTLLAQYASVNVGTGGSGTVAECVHVSGEAQQGATDTAVPSVTLSTTVVDVLLMALGGNRTNRTWSATAPSTLIANATSAGSGGDVMDGATLQRAAATAGSYTVAGSTATACEWHLHVVGLVTPAAGGGAQTVTAPLVDAGATVYSPTVSPGDVSVSPPLVDAGAAVFSPTVSPGPVTVSPPLVDAGPQVFSPTVTPQQVTVSAPLVDSGPVVYEPTVSSGSSLSITAPLVDAVGQVFSPVVSPGPVTISPPLVDAVGQVFSPAVTVGAALISPPLVDATAAVFAPTVTGGTVAAAGGGLIPLLRAG